VTRGSSLLVVSGLRAEARIAAGAGVRTLAGGGNVARLAAAIDRSLGEDTSGLLSFGMAGGLEPGLAPGTIVVPGVVIVGTERFATDPLWTRNLRAMLPRGVEAALAGVTSPVATISGKAGLRATTGAAAADMESHIAARAARRFGLPFAALRVIADPAERALPRAAIAALGEDGRPDLWALLRSLFGDPAQLSPLIGVAADARRAMAVLADCARLLGCKFGRPAAGPER
jgi:adenosylhomocysteine nucleosidase